MLLITRQDFTDNHRNISQSDFNSGILNQNISDAQFMDVQKLMGVDFYDDLIRNNADANYQALLIKGEYSYNGKIYTNYGLKAVIVFYSYSRYILTGSSVDTPFGFVTKESQHSTPVSKETKKSIFKMNQQIAYNYWENVALFLERNKEDYPLWKNNCVNTRSTFRISKISR